jgi:hypothetical protein
MKKDNKHRSRTQGAWLQEVAAIDLQIRERQNEVKQLKALKREILEKHKKRRRCLWDADTPMIRIVNLHQLDYFKKQFDKWKTLTAETIDPTKTTQFLFYPDKLSQATHAAAHMLWHDPPVFKVTASELCRYLSAHSNLGSPESIRQALYRMRKML